MGGLLWAGVEREQAYAELQNALREGHQDVLTVQNESEVPWVAADFRVESINQLMDEWAVNHGLIIEDEEHQTLEKEKERLAEGITNPIKSTTAQ